MEKLNEVCKIYNIDHRLTILRRPKTNGMVESVNIAIKANTHHQYTYGTWTELELHMEKFLIFYNCQRLHSSLMKELECKTPLQACVKWKNRQPDIFIKQHLPFDIF